MNPKNHHFSLGKLVATLWLFLGWFAQVIPLSAFSAGGVEIPNPPKLLVGMVADVEC